MDQPIMNLDFANLYPQVQKSYNAGVHPLLLKEKQLLRAMLRKMKIKKIFNER